MGKKVNHAIDRMVKWLDTKKMSVIVFAIFILSMIPIWYLAFYARPSGDDYGYSANSHMAWINTHSIVEVIKAGLEMTKSMLNTWNGDWFTVFLFTLMPEVFVPYSFWIVPLFMTAIVILSTHYFVHEILVNRLGMKWYESLMASSLILIATYQFIPSTAIGMYWYVGVVHYMMPHAVAMMLLGFLSKFERSGKYRYVVYSAFGAVMIGGSSYFSALLLFMVYAMAWVICCRKNKKIFWTIVPFVCGSIALLIQIKMPGNAVRAARGGSEFELSFLKIVDTIVQSIIQSVVRIGEYFTTKTFIFVLLLVLAVLMWECLGKAGHLLKVKYPGIFVLFMYGIYAAMFAPEVYAAVEVSLGPATMQYVTFILAAAASIIYMEIWMINKKREKNALYEIEAVRYRKLMIVPVVIACGIVMILNRGMIKNSVFFRSCEYVLSGQAADFKKQIDSQMEILLDDSVKEAYLCPINDDQGPLMHMPVTENPEAFTNQVVARFYGKDKVVMTSQ